MKKISDLGLEIKNCRGQCYDNASNMSGIYGGLQAKILEESPTAFYVPCSNHSLNLVGNNAAECCRYALSYFDFVQNLYTFFSASTYRWEMLKSHILSKRTVKQLSDTRWSARVDAVSALRESYGEIKKALIKVSESETERPSTKLEANSLAKKFDKHEIAFMTILRDRILRRMDKVSKFLQKRNINLKMAINQIHSLRLFFEEVRNDYSGIEAEVLALSSSILRSDDGKNKRKRKRFPDENVDGEIHLEGTEKVRVEILNVICDSLIVELEKRKEKLEYVSNVFKEVFY